MFYADLDIVGFIEARRFNAGITTAAECPEGALVKR